MLVAIVLFKGGMIMNAKFFLVCSILIASLTFLGMLSASNALIAVIVIGIISFIF